MKWSVFVNNLIKPVGIQVVKYPGKDIVLRNKIIIHSKVNLIFDVGANEGQFAREMRLLGYKGRLISFEPINSIFQILFRKSSKDPYWFVNQYALGDHNGKIKINIAGNMHSSSILNMLPAHEKFDPGSSYIATEEIEIKSMDSIFNTFYHPGDSIMLKIDTQGYERQVLEGAKDSLKYIKIIKLEMSLLPLYEGEMLFMDMVRYLEKLGYSLFSLENGFCDESTGQLLQVDGILSRMH